MNLQEAYMTMQNEFEKNVSVGSKVRIVRRAKNKELGWNDIWNEPTMDKLICKTGYITDYTKYGIRVESENLFYYFPFFVLEVLEVKQSKPEPEFKPFDQVLVRDSDKNVWRCGYFSHKNNNYGVVYPYVTTSSVYMYCIPYKGNEHLAGTTNNPGE